jgi:hypothetical protein
VGQKIHNVHGIGGQGANANPFAVADELLHIRPVGTNGVRGVGAVNVG